MSNFREFRDELDLSTHDLSFTKVAETSEIPVGKMKMVRINDGEVLIANVNGSFYAIANPCTHKSGSLSEGSLEGSIVTCPIHGSRFDVTTGKSVLGPKTLFSRAKTGDATSIELRVDGGDILLHQRSPWGI
jgi:nitrite reductase/ring-hydroxylating ferredoxin subunit